MASVDFPALEEGGQAELESVSLAKEGPVALKCLEAAS